MHQHIKKFITLCLVTGILFGIYGLLYKIYIPRIMSFGCFDDCSVFVPAYFMLKGKALYTQIFFNHQMLMPMISALIQQVTHPINIYELILRHRQFLLLFSFICNLILLYRFGFITIFYVVFYEFTKFYIFGDRFLPESFIVYPLVYLIGLIWLTSKNKHVYPVEYIFAAIATWFVIFMREPYTLVAIAAYGILLLGKTQAKIKGISVVVFLILCLLPFHWISFSDFFFNVVTVNNATVFSQESSTSHLFGSGMFAVFFYPFYILWGYTWNVFRFFLVGIDILFLMSCILFYRLTKNRRFLMSIFLLLGLANVRYIIPGTLFYAAFHMTAWYGMFLFAFTCIVRELTKRQAIFMLSAACIVYILCLTSPHSYLREKPDPQYDLIVNYGMEQQIGEVVQTISQPQDTLFLDGRDDLIYWQAQRLSSYTYGWYTSVMPSFPLYREARDHMFMTNPPDFYYRYCTKIPNPQFSLPHFLEEKYQMVYAFGHETCLYVKKDKISQISTEQLQKLQEMHYRLLPN